MTSTAAAKAATPDKGSKRKLEIEVPNLEKKVRPKIPIAATPNRKTIASRDELTTIPNVKEEGVLNVGDLVWVKLPGYPHWPAMISIDPVEKVHTKRAGGFKVGNVYHVQYFGEKPGRNWTLPNMITPFDGPDLPVQQKQKKGQVIAKSRKKGLEYATAEAVQALDWDRETRVKRLTYEYVLVDDESRFNNNTTTTPTQRKKREAKKRKSEISSEDVYDFDETIDETEQNSQLEMVWSRPRVEDPPANNNEVLLKMEEEPVKHSCFTCKSTENDTSKCSVKNCEKYYHVQCLKNNSYPVNIRSDNNFTCPLHYCLTCYTDLQFPRDINCLKPNKRQLVQCLECPSAFHNDEVCIAAGTDFLDGNKIICPAHRCLKGEKQINVSWCFSCNEGGDLICCELCPAAFHSECIDNPPAHDDDQYLCYDCLSRKPLHYGDVIWIKLGAYRWWPARITQPDDVPENIMKLHHGTGEFPVYFFGTHDYFWSHRGRVFLFVEDDGNQGFGKSASTDKKFKIAVQEARAEFAERKILEVERLEKLKNSEVWPRFKLIRQNRPVNNVQQSTADDKQVSRCECKPDGDVQCANDDCLNRLMMLECSPNTCPCGEKCQNQRFKKRQYPVMVPFRTEHAGWGLRTTQDIKKGDFVIEYVGELIDEAECNRRMDTKIDQGDTTFYFLTIDKDRIIDAGPAANHARFINHSCNPNCETQKWVVNGQTKVGIFAMIDIPAGTELTFNYNLDCRGNEKMQCKCNSANCSGFIGLPPKAIKNNNHR